MARLQGCGPPGVVVPGGRVAFLCGELVDAADGSSFAVNVRGRQEFNNSVNNAYIPTAVVQQTMTAIAQEHAIVKAGRYAHHRPSAARGAPASSGVVGRIWRSLCLALSGLCVGLV